MSISATKRRLERLDKKHLWHPFTQMKEWNDEEPLIITEGRGSFLKDINGRWFLDGVSSIWVTVHGHGKKEINDAIKAQVDKISHSTLLGLTHPPAIELAEKLVNIAPKGLARVFYSDSGSTAVEIGLKMAYQYWQLNGVKEKTKFLSLKNSYHGDTVGAVSVGGIDIFHKIFAPLLFKSFKAPSPYCYRCELKKEYPSCGLQCLKEMEKVLSKNHKKIAGLIIEPLVQGAGGMIVSPPGYLKGVRRLCTKYKVLLIADEVATGFGRTGKMFACEHESVNPDILCVAKGITGGYLPLAATLTTKKIYEAFLGEYKDLKTFFHGHTYTGNQLASAAAIANIDLFKKEKTLQKMQAKIALLKKELAKIAELPHVGDVRQMGFMVGIELVKNKNKKTSFALEDKMGWKVCEKAKEKGLIIRPLGNVIVLMPHLSVSKEELKQITGKTAEAIKEVAG
ncbi:MAG: adenosylmethionine--8-amino-7-oxononanoate transaminase [Thermodesulfovibrionia bacterium]|nr:adenosylmethionine--8-amino-7-oxononanoate transaminase [Thermodesulfovibrionia bacterium]